MLLPLDIREILKSFKKSSYRWSHPKKAIGLETSGQLKRGSVFILIIIAHGLFCDQNSSSFLSPFISSHSIFPCKEVLSALQSRPKNLKPVPTRGVELYTMYGFAH